MMAFAARRLQPYSELVALLNSFQDCVKYIQQQQTRHLKVQKLLEIAHYICVSYKPCCWSVDARVLFIACIAVACCKGFCPATSPLFTSQQVSHKHLHIRLTVHRFYLGITLHLCTNRAPPCLWQSLKADSLFVLSVGLSLAINPIPVSILHFLPAHVHPMYIAAVRSCYQHHHQQQGLV